MKPVPKVHIMLTRWRSFRRWDSVLTRICSSPPMYNSACTRLWQPDIVRSVLIISVYTNSNLGCSNPRTLLIFTCPLKVQISQGLGPFFRIELLKTGMAQCNLHSIVKYSTEHPFATRLRKTAKHKSSKLSTPTWNQQTLQTIKQR